MAQENIPRFVTIGVNEGLSQSSVNSIYQDSHGYMWFGTGDGLNCYDGTGVKVFRVPYDTLAPINATVIRDRMIEDAKGNIWFTTETGLYYFDWFAGCVVSSVTWARRNELKKYQWAGLVWMDSLNNAYLINHGTGVLQYNTVNGATRDFPVEWIRNPGGFATFSAVDRQGNIWFRRQPGAGVWVFSTTAKAYSRRLDNRDILYICFGRHKTYVLQPGKLCIADSGFHITDSFVFTGNEKNLRFRAVFEDAAERPWLLTRDKGIMRYDTLLKSFFPYSGNNASVFNYPITMYNDRNNNIWIGTEGNGVCRVDIKPRRFHLFPVSKSDYPGLTSYFIKSICEDSSGLVWFSTHGGGLYTFKKEKNQLLGIRIAGDIAGAIFRDAAGNMWVSGNKGIFLYRNGSFTKIRQVPEPVIDNGYVSKFFQLDNGDIIAATSLELLRLREHNGVWTCKTINGFPGGKISDIIRTGNGDMWMSLRYIGLYRVGLDNDVFEIKEKSLSGINIGDLYINEADPRVLWVAADKGLIRFSLTDRSTHVYNEADGMKNCHVYGILEDGKHNLWMSTNGGICRMNRETNVFTNYTVKDGLQSNEFNSGAFYKNDKGVMYFGGVNGFNWFNPLAEATDTTRPLLDLVSITINDSAINSRTCGEVTIPYNKKNISFSFAIPDYTQPDANMLSYTLDSSGKWQSTLNKTVSYSNLSAGRYTLYVKAINSIGMESGVYTVVFTVLPPFWKTYWFALLVIAVIAGSIVVITKKLSQQKLRRQLAELERQREIENERQRISREMHDDIGAGLTRITLMSEMASNKFIDNGPRELTEIASTSRKLVTSMSEIIWSLNPEGRNLERFFAYLRESLNQLLEYSGMNFSIDFPEEPDNIYLSDEQRRNILLIIKEAVNNAVKYSKAAHITISATAAGKELNFEIKDDGIGFDTRNQAKGNGLGNMHRRAATLGAAFIITSVPGGGTTIKVSIPLKSHSGDRK